MAEITLDHVTMTYPNGVTAVDDVSLEIKDGEFLVLVGPSGCGKSSLLRVIAGLESARQGRVLIGGQDVTTLQPKNRDIAMVFQSYALYPHMTVRGNLSFGLSLRRTPKDEIRRRVEHVAQILGLEDLLDRRPGALSGGQRQRVAMGRAMVREPKAYLMDEPLSNLDAALRVAMRSELLRLHERLAVTTVYVTHDQVEAMTLGQRVAVLRDGVVQQIDAPQVLYDHPANLFVAAFIGSPSMNLTEAEIVDGVVHFAGMRIQLPTSSPLRAHAGRVVLGVRPEDFRLRQPDDPADLPRLLIRPDVVEELGAERHLLFSVDARPVATGAGHAPGSDDEARLLATDRDRSHFTARVHGRERITAGADVELVVATDALHAFDCETGRSLTQTL